MIDRQQTALVYNKQSGLQVHFSVDDDGNLPKIITVSKGYESFLERLRELYDSVINETLPQEEFLHILAKLRIGQCCLCGSIFPQGKSYKSFTQQNSQAAYCNAHHLDPHTLEQCFP